MYYVNSGQCCLEPQVGMKSDVQLTTTSHLQIIFIFQLQPMLTQVTSLWAIYQVSHCSRWSHNRLYTTVIPTLCSVMYVIAQDPKAALTLTWIFLYLCEFKVETDFSSPSVPKWCYGWCRCCKDNVLLSGKIISVYIIVANNNDTGQNISSFNHLVYNRNRWPVNLLSPR